MFRILLKIIIELYLKYVNIWSVLLMFGVCVSYKFGCLVDFIDCFMKLFKVSWLWLFLWV